METEDKLLQLQAAIQKFAEEHVILLGLCEPHKEYQVTISVKGITTPVVKVKLELEPWKVRVKRGKRISEQRPLTTDEWNTLRTQDLIPSHRKIVEYFANSGNKSAKGTELIKAGILTQSCNPRGGFNQFLGQRGLNFALRKSTKLPGPWYESTFRIFVVS